MLLWMFFVISPPFKKHDDEVVKLKQITEALASL